MFGLGGLLTEWYGRLSEKRSHVILSASEFDVEGSLDRLEATEVGKLALRSSRLHAEAPVRAESMKRTLEGLVALAELRDAQGRWLFEELEMNPMAAVDGQLIAIDALVTLAEPSPPPRPARPVVKVRQLLHPRSAVVYGASATAQNAGRIILHNLKQAAGLDYGHLYAIHPKADRIEGVPCFRSAAELPEVVDLAVISIPAALAPDAIDDLVRNERTHSIILIPGGFAETGDEELARRIQRTLAQSRETPNGGPVLVGGNCLGVVSKHEYNTFFLPSYKLPFHDAPGDELVAIGQSGAYLVTFTSNLEGVIFPRASISYGNEMDLTVSDFLEYYLEHETEPQVLAFYIEGLQPGEGDRFCRLVRRATRSGRAVVVYKAGHTDFGARAAASHTASVAGDYTVARNLLLQAGAILCETLNMFEDYTKVLTMLHSRIAPGRRVGVISNAGFEAGAVSDHLYSLEMAEFSERTRLALAGVLPDIAHVGNPIDATPMADTSAFVRAVEIMAEAEEVDVIVASAIPATPALDVLAPDFTGQHDENAFAMTSLPAELGRVFRQTRKPMVVAIDSGRLYDPSVLLLERAGVPVYRKIDRASRALSALVVHQLGLHGPDR
jgi:acyl-CoA synthetase (NDP forming)